MEDITNCRFGALTPVEFVGHGKWRCICDCGNTDYVTRAVFLKRGDIKSCGCGIHRFGVLTGRRFGRLTVSEFVGRSRWLCKCDCGKTKVVKASDLVRGDVQSCGCYKIERTKQGSKTHGLSKNSGRLYSCWISMRDRCNNPNNAHYHRYGGRGIKICDEWSDYKKFYEWSHGNGFDPSKPWKECTLDRIDNDGDYCPENCRWTTQSIQILNQKHVRHHRRGVPVDLVGDNGEVISTFESISAAAKETGCKFTSVSNTCRGAQHRANGMIFQYHDESLRRKYAR